MNPNFGLSKNVPRESANPLPSRCGVNPDVAAETHPYISTGLRQHKFGVPIHAARKLYAKAGNSPHLRVTAVSVHIGSQITDTAPFAQAMERVLDLVRELRADGHTIQFVDIGGGLGIDYQGQPGDFAHKVARYATAVSKQLHGLNLHLLLEPGRSIAGPAGGFYSPRSFIARRMKARNSSWSMPA